MMFSILSHAPFSEGKRSIGSRFCCDSLASCSSSLSPSKLFYLFYLFYAVFQPVFTLSCPTLWLHTRLLKPSHHSVGSIYIWRIPRKHVCHCYGASKDGDAWHRPLTSRHRSSGIFLLSLPIMPNRKSRELRKDHHPYPEFNLHRIYVGTSSNSVPNDMYPLQRRRLVFHQSASRAF
jgi:hypothetical protein